MVNIDGNEVLLINLKKINGISVISVKGIKVISVCVD